MGSESSSQPMAATKTEVFLNTKNQFSHPENNPVIQAIGVKKWNRLSKSTQAITKEITKLLESNDDYPGLTLTQFNSSDYDQFVKDAERQLCYKNLTRGFTVKNDPFSIDPEIMVYTRSPQQSDGTESVRDCFGMVTMNQSIAYPGVFVRVRHGLGSL